TQEITAQDRRRQHQRQRPYPGGNDGVEDLVQLADRRLDLSCLWGGRHLFSVVFLRGFFVCCGVYLRRIGRSLFVGGLWGPGAVALRGSALTRFFLAHAEGCWGSLSLTLRLSTPSTNTLPAIRP